MHIDPDHLVTDANALQALYGSPGEASLKKEVDHVHPHYRAFIEASPFAMLATCGPDGLDASPRGDPAGFVVVEDEKTLLLPDRRGNNRVDSLLNVLADPRVALLFLVPGVGETLRVNGTARISVDPALLARFAVDDKLPRSVLIVDVQTVYFQCSRALLRSRLWDPATQMPRSALPSVGRILSDLTAGTFDGVTYDRDLPARVAGTLY
ncbi:MAG: pyridoxamine 5'-phosphate oxidase family protein [Achromobacter sp.]|uniref:pyridoxamine 5'-phosphate oxidase family protein n=1 Tax=Achromobacter sp. TaxID=134375 RepID=UPI0012C1305B|nr:pyridoxamine 5'-phosphate oxidase family protein [Achromobacter sp.]MPS81918.1 pyridoxamine 5'-phosphate oxidase family protein [Achromobacter sp.]